MSSGYVGSTLLGGAFVLAGWDTLVAKILSFVLGVGLVMPLVLVRDKLYVLLFVDFSPSDLDLKDNRADAML